MSTPIISSSSSLYEVLRIPAGATSQEIKSAYRRLALTFHPDVARKDDTSTPSARDEFIRIHAAYSTLSDPEKRAVYDRNMFATRRNRIRPLTSSPGGRGYYSTTVRNWETDQCW